MNEKKVRIEIEEGANGWIIMWLREGEGIHKFIAEDSAEVSGRVNKLIRNGGPYEQRKDGADSVD